MTEIPLDGGRTTKGVVWVGNTIRRPAGPHSAFVARLLRHLHQTGFEAAPRFQGTDEQGRDVFGYVEGDVPKHLGWHDDAVLIAAAALIRRYHDATVLFLRSTGSCRPDAEIICHNDLSPCNFVFRGAAPHAIIDFDAAAPGTRAEDVGYAVWLWLNVGNAGIDAEEQRRRFRVFSHEYDPMLNHRAVLDAMIAHQKRLIAEGRRLGRDAMAQWAGDCLNWTKSWL